MLGARCQVLDARCQVLGARCQMLSARCQVLDARCQVLDTRCQVLGAMCQMLDARCQVLGARCQMLEFNSRWTFRAFLSLANHLQVTSQHLIPVPLFHSWPHFKSGHSVITIFSLLQSVFNSFVMPPKTPSFGTQQWRNDVNSTKPLQARLNRLRLR